MANRNNPRGFVLSTRGNSGGDVQVRHYWKASGAYLYPGDVIARGADSFLTRTLTPGTTPLLGVVQRFSDTTKAEKVPVCDQTDAVYVAMADGSGLVEADMGLNANVKKGTADATLKYSKDVIDSTTINTTNTLDLHLIRAVPRIDNAYGQYVMLQVVFNAHRMYPATVGV